MLNFGASKPDPLLNLHCVVNSAVGFANKLSGVTQKVGNLFCIVWGFHFLLADTTSAPKLLKRERCAHTACGVGKKKQKTR